MFSYTAYVTRILTNNAFACTLLISVWRGRGCAVGLGTPANIEVRLAHTPCSSS